MIAAHSAYSTIKPLDGAAASGRPVGIPEHVAPAQRTRD